MFEALIQKLEAAVEWDEQLDREIEDAIDGDGRRLDWGPYPYTSKIDAARGLLDRVLPGWSYRVARCAVSDDAWVIPDFNCPIHGERLRAELRQDIDWSDLTDVDLRPSGREATALCISILKALEIINAKSHQAPEASPAEAGTEAWSDGETAAPAEIRADGQRAQQEDETLVVDLRSMTDKWPPVKKAIWDVVVAAELNGGKYINSWDLTEKLFAAVQSSVDYSRHMVASALAEINIHQETENYEWRGDGDYTPNEKERSLLEDFGNGLISTVQERIRAAIPATEPVSSIVPDHCSGTALAFEGGCLHVRKDGSGYIIVDEDDFKLEDDRCEGEHGPEGSVHWIARFPAGEMTALRNFLNGQEFSALSAPSVAVKALEWNPYRAETPFGWYQIEDQRSVPESELKGRPPFLLFGSRLDYSRHPTLEAARATAQADYEARIRSALSAQGQDVARDLPSEFEKWWDDAGHYVGGVVKMTYTQRKQLAWDAFYASANPAAPAKQEGA